MTEYVLYVKRGALAPVAQGSLDDIQRFINGQNAKTHVLPLWPNPKDFEEETVTFVYRKGHGQPDEKRVVTVDECSHSYLAGTDAEKNEYRKFKVANIVGGLRKVTILNI